MIPASIFNDVSGSQVSLGYDTALNSIVKSIDQVKDTANSLLNSKHRIFCVQLPGFTPCPLLFDAGLAVDGEVIVDGGNKQSLKQLKRVIQRKHQSGKSYSIILMNEGVNPQIIRDYLSRSIEIDFKIVQIDEALCMGNPSASDIVLANKMAGCTLDWIIDENASGSLSVKSHNISLQI